MGGGGGGVIAIEVAISGRPVELGFCIKNHSDKK